jgi:hypothetical protein
MHLNRKLRFALIIAAAVVLYCAGVIVRSRYGVRVVVWNTSGQALHQVTVKLEHGREYALGDIIQGKQRTIFVEPAGGDTIRLGFNDAGNSMHISMLANYVESGYCGDVTARIYSDERLSVSDKSFAAYNWKSWWGFIG